MVSVAGDTVHIHGYPQLGGSKETIVWGVYGCLRPSLLPFLFALSLLYFVLWIFIIGYAFRELIINFLYI